MDKTHHALKPGASHIKPKPYDKGNEWPVKTNELKPPKKKRDNNTTCNSLVTEN